MHSYLPWFFQCSKKLDCSRPGCHWTWLPTETSRIPWCCTALNLTEAWSWFTNTLRRISYKLLMFWLQSRQTTQSNSWYWPGDCFHLHPVNRWQCHGCCLGTENRVAYWDNARAVASSEGKEARIRLLQHCEVKLYHRYWSCAMVLFSTMFWDGLRGHCARFFVSNVEIVNTLFELTSDKMLSFLCIPFCSLHSMSTLCSIPLKPVILEVRVPRYPYYLMKATSTHVSFIFCDV